MCLESGHAADSANHPKTTDTHDLGVAAINYNSAWSDHVFLINGKMVIDNWPFIQITLIAITATIGVLWMFSTKQPQKPE